MAIHAVGNTSCTSMEPEMLQQLVTQIVKAFFEAYTLILLRHFELFISIKMSHALILIWVYM